MLRFYKDEGIVIKRKNYSESDKILTIFTPRFGKLRLLAKGIRKIKSKRASHLELFNQVEVSVVKGKIFDLITEAASIRTNMELKKNLDILSYIYKTAEILDALLPESEPDERLYKDLKNYLEEISLISREGYARLSDDFSCKTLKILGYLREDTEISGVKLDSLIESIIEKKLKSRKLISRLAC